PTAYPPAPPPPAPPPPPRRAALRTSPAPASPLRLRHDRSEPDPRYRGRPDLGLREGRRCRPRPPLHPAEARRPAAHRRRDRVPGLPRGGPRKLALPLRAADAAAPRPRRRGVPARRREAPDDAGPDSRPRRPLAHPPPRDRLEGRPHPRPPPRARLLHPPLQPPLPLYGLHPRQGRARLHPGAGPLPRHLRPHADAHAAGLRRLLPA